MKIRPHAVIRMLILLLLPAILLSCNLPLSQPTNPPPTETPPPSPVPPPAAPPTIAHINLPSNNVSSASLVYDVESSGTAPEKRAPYGDSYNINRLERPFSQDMTYIPDLDIVTYQVNEDDPWIYVSLELIGTNPNNDLGIHYGVEIDNDADGFGDTIVWASPPYTENWTAENVQVFADKNHDTSGVSATKSDAPFDGDGYETLIFDGGQGDDPDLAWVRINAGPRATVQFAFKRTLTDGKYMLGVLADTGLKDVGQLDYVDRFTAEQAGSPVRSEPYYPLKALYAVDNACREAFGFIPSGFEPQLCPQPETPTPKPGKPPGPTPVICQQPAYCVGPSYAWHQDTCICETIGPY
jgi:hypothetical protein